MSVSGLAALLLGPALPDCRGPRALARVVARRLGVLAAVAVLAGSPLLAMAAMRAATWWLPMLLPMR